MVISEPLIPVTCGLLFNKFYCALACLLLILTLFSEVHGYVIMSCGCADVQLSVRVGHFARVKCGLRLA
jgi:hypothetical protein